MSAPDTPTDDRTTKKPTNGVAKFTVKLGALRARAPNAADALVDAAYSIAKGDDQEAADALEDAATRLRGGTN